MDASGAILGTAPRSLYKYAHQRPDMRHGTWSVQLTYRPQCRACDQFFAELYISAAAHLSEQHSDISNIGDAIAHDDSCGLDSAPRPAPEGNSPSLDMAWTPDESLNAQLLMATAADVAAWPP